MNWILSICFAGVILALPAPARATIITYDVDLGGVATITYSPPEESRVPPVFRIVGTVDYDSAADRITDSRLSFFHDTRSFPMPLSSIDGLGTSWRWEATPSELRFVRNAVPPGQLPPRGVLRWKAYIDDRNFYSFSFVVREPEIYAAGNWTYGLHNGSQIGYLGFPDTGYGLPGFLLGTAAAVPEPETVTLALLGLGFLWGAATRRRM